MIDVKDYIESAVGTESNGVPKAEVKFVSTRVDTLTEEASGNPIDCNGAEVNFRDLGGFIMLDLKFSNPESTDMRMVYNYLEKYANDLNDITEDSTKYPETAFFITSKQHKDYYILLANPMFWSWNTSTRTGEYDTIRILFEEEKYGFFKDAA